MLYGYGILNNHVPTLKATVMKISTAVSTLLTSLYAVYKGESNANDSLATYNGTAQGGLTYSGGKSGNAFTFNGSNAYIQLPTDSLNSLTGNFSVSFWVYFTDLSNNSVIQSTLSNYATNGVNEWGFVCYTIGNQMIFYIAQGTPGGVTLKDSAIGSINTWYNYTFVRKSGTSSKIYKNGDLVVSNSSNVNPVYSSTNMTPSIGVINNGPLLSNLLQYYMRSGGMIDELNIWNKELTSTEVTELYNAGTGKFYPY